MLLKSYLLSTYLGFCFFVSNFLPSKIDYSVFYNSLQSAFAQGDNPLKFTPNYPDNGCALIIHLSSVRSLICETLQNRTSLFNGPDMCFELSQPGHISHDNGFWNHPRNQRCKWEIVCVLCFTMHSYRLDGSLSFEI